MLEVARRVIVPQTISMVFSYPHTNGEPHMSTHSYSRLWTHLVWETLNREPMLYTSSGQGFHVPQPVLARKGHLYEDQLLQCGSHSRID